MNKFLCKLFINSWVSKCTAKPFVGRLILFESSCSASLLNIIRRSQIKAFCLQRSYIYCMHDVLNET